MAVASDIGRRVTFAAVPARILAILVDRSEAGRSRLFAAGAFLARVCNAGLGFLTQILLARWMGEHDYGIYSSLWVWLLVGGGVMSLGLPVAALKFVPDYREHRDPEGLRGFLRGAVRFGALPSLAASTFGVALALGAGPEFEPYRSAALVALAILPIYVLTDIQTGIARAWNFADLGLLADYLVRPLLLLAFAGALALAGFRGGAVAVMAATGAAVLLTALVQGLALGRRLATRVPAGPARADLGRWAATCWPLLTVTGFTLLLGAVDILILQFFVTPEEVAVYFAATKIVAVASFVSYGVANTSAHRFAAQVARGDRDGMARLAAETVRWTFWPTLVVAATLAILASPLLRIFGPSFGTGAPVVAWLALGLVAAAAVGPADRALAMADHGRATAWIYGIAIVANALLCLALIPRWGLPGAAVGTAIAGALRAALLFDATRRRLGIAMSILSPARSA